MIVGGSGRGEFARLLSVVVVFVLIEHCFERVRAEVAAADEHRRSARSRRWRPAGSGRGRWGKMPTTSVRRPISRLKYSERIGRAQLAPAVGGEGVEAEQVFLGLLQQRPQAPAHPPWASTRTNQHRSEGEACAIELHLPPEARPYSRSSALMSVMLAQVCR
jgi:hypothetical protein